MSNHPSEDKTKERIEDLASLPAYILDSQALFLQRKEILIKHNGAFYRLRITRQNKLILTK
ncbi:MAG: hemin uptake protein HemP [Candidatus Thiodiazotropha sp. (ex Lucinoma annulata)]|nr:hemin uptake protein HemP [Candidatus Thiodiazotropha sp. (ex Troendleina suluensis)]MCU7865200.1 hemin uptake protein HemP [Candidatus Thiodiazotropha sp. (ex Lucinoma borealis)]MCU7884395.1 hemin uptake protein HemP [Candidatus Thiodiazotropha sp. (ex Lucinoma annulata)]MCU7946472.1 hemin uptake protein HemP [Candidatus Thiodiazotropha sp. (ex Cardiolucina cf. quadrata)]